MGLRLIELDEGFPCYVSGEFEARFIYAEIFQDNNYDHAGLPEAPFVVDVGANIGLFSLFMKRRYPSARIAAFEPAPQNVEALRQNLALHRAEGVTIHPFCLGAEDQAEARLTYYPEMPGNSTLHPREKDLQRSLMGERLGDDRAAELFTATEVTVPVHRLSRVLAEHHGGETAIDLLKVDVEGAELDVLNGIDAADWARIGTVLLEVTDFDGKLTGALDLLHRHGFRTTDTPVPFMWEELRFHYVTATRA
ncbi:FkbM family methyltransferase [Micromonospora sp. NPDC002296]|uniref:FkbM family methyltransferase n=1 Tax=Micromonospora sp. NPDC002296 TaxID=3154271 RepID=UPI003316E3A3